MCGSCFFTFFEGILDENELHTEHCRSSSPQEAQSAGDSYPAARLTMSFLNSVFPEGAIFRREEGRRKCRARWNFQGKLHGVVKKDGLQTYCSHKSETLNFDKISLAHGGYARFKEEKLIKVS